MNVTMHSTINHSIERLANSRLASFATLRPCSEAELVSLETSLGIELPKAYRSFLKLCGAGAGEFLCGTKWEFKELAQLQKAASEMMVNASVDVSWKESFLAFAIHQGYQMLYFDCNNGGDPKVMLFVSDDGPPREVAATFSEWLSGCVDDEIASYVELPRHN